MNTKLRLVTGFMLLLLLNLSLVSALQIANVRAEPVTDTTAVIHWDTDEPGDSFLSYGTSKENQQSIADANPVRSHSFSLTGLTPSTRYVYSVKSSTISDDNNGNLYSFETLAPDTTAPEITAKVPAIIAGNSITITGTTEAGAEVKLLVNSNLAGITTSQAENESDATGTFSFPDVALEPNSQNNLTLEAKDRAHNVGTFSALIYADTAKPKLELTEVPSFVTENSIRIIGNSSEPVSFEIMVNNRSVATGGGQRIEQTIALSEGQNTIRVIATDNAGLQTIHEFSVESDTAIPTLEAEIERGTEYYEGRAESNIHGKTKPGADAYIYIYRPMGFEFTPDFQKARAKVMANAKGEFSFEDIKFSQSITDFALEDLAPREIPAGLLVTIPPIVDIAQQEQATYYVYIIVEDKSGRTAYWQATVNVHSCYSSNLDFSVQSVPKFQGPLRLVPQLMDDGKQEIQAVFQFEYQGDALSTKDAQGRVLDPGHQITSVEIEPACTQGMLEDEKFSLGCKVMPRVGRKIQSGDYLYMTWNLLPAADISQKETGFWNDLKKRQVIFPLKITIHYQEKSTEVGTAVAGPGETQAIVYGTPKFQTSCTDLGYFVDIPIDSEDLVPDFIADEGVAVINGTLNAINTVEPFVKKAYLITGIGCISSSGLRTVARWSRILTSKAEAYYDFVKPKRAAEQKGETFDQKGKGCPLPFAQHELYLKDNIDAWCKQGDRKNLPTTVQNACDNTDLRKTITLEDRCPKSAAAWKFEAVVNKAYQGFCDRAFCRSAPARWTEDEDLTKIQAKIIKEQQCAVTGRGVPLIKRENCQDLLKKNPIHLPEGTSVTEVGNDCWQTAEGVIYYYKETDNNDEANLARNHNIYYLTPVGRIFGSLAPPKERLIVYQPEGSQDFIVGRSLNCDQVCKNPRKPGYSSAGCKTEEIVEGKSITRVEEGQYLAGYTRDCFIKGYLSGTVSTPPVFEQCVCTGERQEIKPYTSENLALRTADPKEEYFYQQERTFKESSKTVGTYYPEIRYYAGRDWTATFGADYLLDYTKSEKDREVPQINPHSNLIGTLQTVCLSTTLKNLVMVKSILTGMQSCIQQAKYTGLQDAGMCKTLFTQHVCGLAYQAVAYLLRGCNPTTFDDVAKEGLFGDVGFFTQAGFESMGEALDSSITDLRDDYGNAQLNEYFKGGVQGFAQSACLAMFGAEFPLLSDEFLLDAALATPTATNVLIAPAQRELSTYNPAKQTAIHNYKIGGLIFPGCRIRRATVSLKCIGPEDLPYRDQGVDPSCLGEGCDCINAQSAASPLEGEKEKIIWNNPEPLSGGQMYSIPLESPQRLDSHYRYDHVIVKVELDPTEKGNEDQCFDQGFSYAPLKGIFYTPIKDISPTQEIACQVDLVSGRYVCPELATIFGEGATYLEAPFIDCWNKKTQTWADCNTPNMFVLGDEIKVRVHINSAGKAACLKRTIRGGIAGPRELPPRPLAENLPGPLQLPEVLGVVTEEMFGGTTSSTISRFEGQSNVACHQYLPALPGSSASAGTIGGPYQFRFQRMPDGLVQLFIPADVGFQDPSYSRDPRGNLIQGTRNTFSLQDINRIVFNINGVLVNQVMGNVPAEDANAVCSYQLGSRSSSSTAGTINTGTIDVTYELLDVDEGGTCLQAHVPVKTAFGRQSARQSVRVQREEVAFQQVGGVHDSFISGNYDNVHILSQQILSFKLGDLQSATALYYDVASYIMQGVKETSNYRRYETQIKNLLNAFFSRNLAGIELSPWQADVQSTDEFQKIDAYMKIIAQQFGVTVPGRYEVTASGTSTGSAGAVTVTAAPLGQCTTNYNIDGTTLTLGDAPYAYKCLSQTEAASCRKSDGNIVSRRFTIPTANPLYKKCNPTSP